MFKRPFISAIILMAGKGERFQSRLPKQFHKIAGRYIFEYTLDPFIASKDIAQIILVSSLDLPVALSHSKIKIVTGGETRQRSSYLGLKACHTSCDYVLIHDGARPFVTSKIIERNIKAVMQHNAVDTCIPCSDTIVQSKNETTIDRIPDRSTFFRGQTPQSFAYSLIMQAHEKALQMGKNQSTDDCQLVKELGADVFICRGDETNIKITTPFDLVVAQQMMHSSLCT